jgi:hypothetical protein
MICFEKDCRQDERGLYRARSSSHVPFKDVHMLMLVI